MDGTQRPTIYRSENASRQPLGVRRLHAPGQYALHARPLLARLDGSLGGLRNKVKSARLLAGGKDVKFDQDDFRVRFTGLPEKAPDDPVTTIAIECDSEPRQDMDAVRRQRPRREA